MRGLRPLPLRPHALRAAGRGPRRASVVHMTAIRRARRAFRSLSLMVVGFAYGATSCATSGSPSASPSAQAAGSSCNAAGGSCLLGGATCEVPAGSSAQDCDVSHPAGAFCCLAFDGGVSSDGATSAADASRGNADASPGDAGTTDSAPCAIVLASQYDQSCVVDSDCVGVGEVPSCPAAACDSCITAAVNSAAAAQYGKAFEEAFASRPPGTLCGCNCESSPACSHGKCQARSCGPSNTMDTCSMGGGQCVSANTPCDRIGPADSCASPDEFCCLP